MNNLSPTAMRIAVLDGLRGYCALWVAVVHLARLLVLHDKYWVPDADIAVGIFFVLSGFVITYLLTQEQESYGRFLFRRYCRLAPVFIFFCVAYIALSNFIVYALTCLDTTQHPVYSLMPAYINGARFWYIHLPAHMLMLHGWLDSIVPNASKAILPEGWSMTVEWQFYLIAPLLLAILQQKKIWSGFLLAMFSILLTLFHVLPGLWVTNFIIEFLAGMVAFLFVQPLQHHLKRTTDWLWLIVFAAAGYTFNKPALMVWSVFLILAFGIARAQTLQIISGLFDNTLSRFLGKVSYSLYLCHMLVIFAVVPVVARYLHPTEQPEKFYLAALPLVLAGSLLLASLTYRFIEQPMIKWSKQTQWP